MEPEPTYSITVFAQLAGVTVRTLHYYEEAGLLAPSRRTGRGHRRYSPDDLLRLQQILTLVSQSGMLKITWLKPSSASAPHRSTTSAARIPPGPSVRWGTTVRSIAA